MTAKSEMIGKSAGKIIFVKTTQTRNLAEHMLISEDKLKTN